jgi:hypothetical protein
VDPIGRYLERIKSSAKTYVPIILELLLLLELVHIRQLHPRLSLLHLVELLQDRAVDGAALLLEGAQLGEQGGGREGGGVGRRYQAAQNQPGVFEGDHTVPLPETGQVLLWGEKE